MILGGRQRNTRDFPQGEQQEGTSREGEEDELEADCNTSKRELQLNSNTPKHVEYAHINTSSIVSGLDAVTCFFDY